MQLLTITENMNTAHASDKIMNFMITPDYLC